MAGDAKLEGKPEAPAPLPPIAGKARDLEALRNAVVDAANVGAGLWFSYLFVLLYLVIAVGSVTHRNLFFENPVRLPFLNVDLPLTGFFVLGPGLFLIIHAYVLLHFAMLADKVGAFHAELQAQIADDDTRMRLRRQLPSNIFVQFLAGPRELRTGLKGAMLRLIALISLVIGPLALLVFFQLQFLPYHDEVVAWWQRIAVVADLALLWALWPSVARGETTSIGWRDFRRPSMVAAAVASLVPVLLVFTIATFPGEWLHRNPVSLPLIPERRALDDAGRPIRWITPHQFLIAGDVDLIARKPTSLWSNRLVLPNLEQPTPSFSLRGRRLEGAVLLSANLQKVDFTAAQLQGAVLDGADLREARFLCAHVSASVDADPTHEERSLRGEQRCARLENASLAGAQLQRAVLGGAKLRRAGLMNARLQGAILDRADLRETNFYAAQLQGTSLEYAQLQGAALRGAALQGARLFQAELRGAALDSAGLQGALLDEARLQGASLKYPQLQGASLQRAHLEGASLQRAALLAADFDSASLDGASLNGAQLQGAWFSRTDFHSASLEKVSIWRTGTLWGKNIRVAEPESVPLTAEPSDCHPISSCVWSSTSFATLQRLMIEHVPHGELRREALERVKTLDPAVPHDREDELAKHWAERAASPPAPEDYFKSVAELFIKTGCDGDGAPYVIRAMIDSLDRRELDSRFINGSAEFHAIVDAFLDDKKCPGTEGQSAKDRGDLRKLRAGLSPSLP